ncbi:MAG: choline dehydrogenase, partial [Ilumatobacteraceae bacterium]
MGDRRYDFVIVGGGSAGCALANRLSADPSNRVLVLEAGRTDWRWDVFIHMPAALSYPIGNRFYDWRYETEPEEHMGGRRVYHARGKVLGGSSSINGMIFQRGNPADYEKWSKLPGLADWGYANCLPYFKRMETCLAGTDEWRGGDGPLQLERGPAVTPLFAAWLEAGRQAGFRITDDVNGFRQEGFSAFDKNVHRGRRLSAARAYLHPVLKRPNLDLVTLAQAERLVFDGTRCTGVDYRRGRTRHHVDAGEVIVSSGAFNTPQLLQLSGIGDPDHLGPLGIDTVSALPGVGQNLQDHLEVYIQHACTQPVSMQPHLAHWRKPWIGLQWLLRRGPAATNHFEAGAFIKSNPSEPYPNLMYHFLPIAIRYDGSTAKGDMPDGHGYQVHVGPMYSDSTGSVMITSTDPREKPAIRFNYLSTERDRREWIEAVRVTRHILGQEAFAPFDGGEISPGPAVQTDQEIMDWVAR